MASDHQQRHKIRLWPSNFDKLTALKAKAIANLSIPFLANAGLQIGIPELCRTYRKRKSSRGL